MTTSDPYQDKPENRSEAGDWHEFTFRFSVDAEVDWDRMDMKAWAAAVCRYTALKMVASAMTSDEIEAIEGPVQSLITNLKVHKLEYNFVTDDELNKFLDGEESRE